MTLAQVSIISTPMFVTCYSFFTINPESALWDLPWFRSLFFHANYATIQRMQPRIVFMGSPEFALPTLKALADRYLLAGVVTQPDRPAGRGREVKSPPVKILAEQFAIPLIQPVRLKEPEALNQLQRWDPDLIVVAAYGQILHPEVLDLPAYGCLNVHASLLPRWRGAAPIQAAIMHGDEQTGVTIMCMDPGLDTGPILSQCMIPISQEDTAGSLSQRLSESGAELLVDTLPAYIDGTIKHHPQDDTLATYAPMLKREDGALDPTRTAEELSRQVRAFNPWPGTYLLWHGGTLKVHRASPAHDALSIEPGRTTTYAGLPAIHTRRGLLLLEQVQPPGKRSMPGNAFLLGARGWEA